MPANQPSTIAPPGAQDASPVALAQSTRDAFQDVLAVELLHRVQNTLAVVLALARLTARSVKTIDEFQVAFGDRIQAMARTNALLLRGHAQALSVKAALDVELEPYAESGGQVTLDCEPLVISAGAALSLSLIIHELATNAAKYGALADHAGLLHVRCEPGPVGGVMIWRETRPVASAEAGRPGSGFLLIERLARELGGEANVDVRPTGLEATISFRLGDQPRDAAPP